MLLALGVLSVAACSSSGDDYGQPLSPDIVPSADYPALGALDSPGSSFAVVTARVERLAGPSVEVGKNGFVSWDNEDVRSGEQVDLFPSLIVSNAELSNVFQAYVDVEALEKQLAKDELRLWYSDGVYQEGRTYAFFLGYWDDSDYSALYGWDVAADEAVDGFRVLNYTDALEELDRVASRREESSTKLELIKSFVAGVIAESETGVRDEYVAAILGPTETPPAPERPEWAYPLMREDLTPDEIKSGEFVEITALIVLDVGDERLVGLRGEKDLGWEQVNYLGYVVLSGFVPRSEQLQLLVVSADANVWSTGERVVGDDKYRDITFSATPDGDDESVYVVIDASADGRARGTRQPVREGELSSLSVYDRAGFESEVEAISSVVDAAQDGRPDDGR